MTLLYFAAVRGLGEGPATGPTWALTCGAPEGIRTPNLLIRSQMLYPLSYGRNALPSYMIAKRGGSGIRTREGL